MHALRKALHQPRDADLVDHLGQLAAADRPEQGDGAGVAVDHRLGAVEHGLVAAAHHRQHAVLGARLPAGHRGIDEADALFLTDRSEEHTSELQSLMRISYAVFCLKKKTKLYS